MKNKRFTGIALLFLLLSLNYLPLTAQDSNCIITAEEFKKQDKKDVVIIDVRTKGEYDNGHLEGVLWIDFSQPDFKERILELDRDKKYVVHCHSGYRSNKAMLFMKENGFKEVCDLTDGIVGLSKAGFKLVK